jgi:hypothetical protein
MPEDERRASALAFRSRVTGGSAPSPLRGGREAASGSNDQATAVRRSATKTPVVRSLGQGVDDLVYVNRGPARDALHGAPPDDRETPEALSRPAVRVREDFITLPLPRLAARSNEPIAEAVESYKREAAVVDARLSSPVTCAFKGMALSDVCDRLRADTGIHLTAGASVADEKVTVLCEKLSLRAVMRQLSRPFGYTWLRSKEASGVGRQAFGESPVGPNAQRPAPSASYRYELVQDLKSQLLEEELRNRDRNAALLALQGEIDRYQPYLALSPDEALARAQTAPPDEKKRLEEYSGWGWGPLQLYARLSPQDQAALRAGRTISFSGDPQRIAKDGARPLPPDLERGILQSMRDVRVRRPGSQTPADNQPIIGRAENLPDGVLPASSPETNGFAFLRIGHGELGQFTLDGGAGVTIGSTIAVRGHDLATGVSPAVQDPKNEAANAGLAHDPALQARVTVDLTPRPPSLGGKGELPVAAGDHGDAGARPPSPSRRGVETERKVTTAEVLEALHRASGLPIAADFYTRLYPRASVSVKGQPLFEALNHLADVMHLRWNKEGNWLRFRSVSYYDDRVKEVPNRLLARWTTTRRQPGTPGVGLPLDELIEMAQLSDAQLDSRFVGEGVEEIWGLDEWRLAQNHQARPHLRYLAQLTPAQRQAAVSAHGLAFNQLTLAQQQGLVAHLGERLHSLVEAASAVVRVEYTHPGWFRWPAFQMPSARHAEPGLFGLAPVREPTRAAALTEALRLDPGATEAQVAPTDLSLAVVYTLIDPQTGAARDQGIRAYGVGDSALINW